jgi:penicillin-insensitive murein endopeptidase
MRHLVALAILSGAGLAHASPFPAAWLPRHGDGYLVPDTWAARGLRYGRPELITLVGRVAERVAQELPGATLYVGDLSLRSGGWTPWHRSHRDGRDVDLLFFATGADGLPVAPPDAMVPFDARGVATLPDGTALRFDVERNWALVRALLEDDAARVVRIFVSHALRAQLLAYAVGIDEPPALLARAAAVLGQPSDSAAHDDHFHVRIAGPVIEEPRRAVAKARAGKAIKAQLQKARPKPKVKALVRHRKPGRRR